MEFELGMGDTHHKMASEKKRLEHEKEMTFLKLHCPRTGSSLYEHLCDIVHYALETKALDNKMDYFEEWSRMLREKRRLCMNRSRAKEECGTNEYSLKIQMILKDDEERRLMRSDLVEEDLTYDCSDVLDTLHLLRRGGVSIPAEEALTIAITMKKLVSSRTLTKLRFWGKVMGRVRDYWVLEAELTDDELDRRMDLAPREHQDELEDLLNRKVYLVCNEAGDAWRELPAIRARHVQAARVMPSGTPMFSGDLDAKVSDFPGSESHLLHAQLVRIAASCTVSPLGAYARSPAARQDLAEDECGVVLNADWLGVPSSVSLADLVEPGLASWVHHVPYLLASGRLADPDDQPDEERATEEEEEEEEEEEDDDDVEEEELLVEDEDSLEGGEEEEDVDRARGSRRGGARGEEAVPLLTPLSRDAAVLGQPSWSARLCSGLLPQTSVAMLRSNRWPGAVAFCSGRKFGCVYFGWGSKAMDGCDKSNAG